MRYTNIMTHDAIQARKSLLADQDGMSAVRRDQSFGKVTSALQP
jgi:hypothetical protein